MTGALLPWSSSRVKVSPRPKILLQLAQEFSSTGAVSSKASQLTTDIPNWHSHRQPVPREEGQSLEGLLWGPEGFQSFSPTKPSPATFPDHHTPWDCHSSPKQQKAAFQAEEFEGISLSSSFYAPQSPQCPFTSHTKSPHLGQALEQFRGEEFVMKHLLQPAPDT